mgnify:CR=1 FL=1
MCLAVSRVHPTSNQRKDELTRGWFRHGRDHRGGAEINPGSTDAGALKYGAGLILQPGRQCVRVCAVRMFDSFLRIAETV